MLGALLQATSAAVPAGPFTPLSPTSAALQLWLDAQDGATLHLTAGGVDTWTDKSTHGNTWTQPSAGARPTVFATGINQHATVRFDGAAQFLQRLTPWALTAAEIFAVFHQNGADGFVTGGLWSFGVGGGVAFGTYEMIPNTDDIIYDSFGSTLRRTAGSPGVDVFAKANGIYNVVSTPSEWTDYVNGVQLFTTATNTVGWASGGFSLGATGGLPTVAHFKPCDVGEVLVYNGKLSPADKTAVTTYLRAKWLGWTPALTRFVVCDGDGLTSGFGVAAGADYPSQMNLLLPVGYRTVENYGVVNRTIYALMSDAASRLDPNFLGVALVPKSIVVIFAGLYDLDQGRSAAATLTDLWTYCDARRTRGWKVVVCTCLPRTSTITQATFDANRATYNASISSGWASHADALSDIAGDSRIGPNGANLNSTYFQADGIHTNATGAGIIASLTATAVQGLS